MSESTSSTSSFDVVTIPSRAQLLHGAIGRHVAAEGLAWTGSHALAALASSPRAETSIEEQVRARWAAVGRMPLATEVLHAAAPQAMSVVGEQLHRLSDAIAADLRRQAAAAADRALRAALLAAVERVRPEERHVVAHAAERALIRIGCTVERAEGTRTTALWATRGHTHIALLVEDGGVLHRDIEGCEGGQCTPTGQAVDDALAAEGVRTVVQRTVVHGDVRGGTMIERAALVRDGCGWPAALVRQAEKGLPGARRAASARADRAREASR